ncbi:hypothetical protein [Vibrio tarriae]|uniref:hypothetical protein n=1 Tax=Vibrio tarriae TaxID=2014742 RepID=UPI000DE54543|nr:hypothetical protein [Vibrio tarriae]RBM30498.1 hypothetical protein DLR58_16685 [Vibrio tarriae]
MNESKKPLLKVKLNQNLTEKQKAEIYERLEYLVDGFGFSLEVSDQEQDKEDPISELVEAIKNQTEAINNLVGSNIAILDELLAQGEADPNELDDDLFANPQSLD